MIYLYVKTHNVTGLKYFGKTVAEDPSKYPGSGKVWRRHLTVHGNDVSTEIIFQSEDKSEIKKMGIYYSSKWDIVKSKSWANLVIECGDGGDNSKFVDYNKVSINNRKPKSTTVKMKAAQGLLRDTKSKEQKEWHKIPENYARKIELMKNCRSKEALNKKSLKMKKLKWFNNGVRSIRTLPDAIPDGFFPGRISQNNR